MAQVGVVNLGILNYKTALEIQSKVSSLLKSKKIPHDGGVLLLLEHFPVYTVGLRTKGYSLQDEIKLRSCGADFQRTNRGGLITFHGPGQLIVYPILNLRIWVPSIRWYINKLEETVIDMCSELSIKAGRLCPHPGIWVGEKKLCAIGVHASRYITTHGISINCNTDLKWFEHIVPCGIKGKGVTSISEQLRKPVYIKDILPLFMKSFVKHFPCSTKYEKTETFCKLLHLSDND